MSRRSPQLAATLLQALPTLLPSVKIARTRWESPERTGELLVDVITPSGKSRALALEITAAPTPYRIPEVAHRCAVSSHRIKRYPVLAARFFSPRARALCREHGVGYIDLAGNCFLRFGDLYLEKVVDKNPFPQRGRPASLFSPVSTRVLRALLEEPKRTWLLSELSQVTTTSLGQTFNVIQRLLQERYVIRQRRRLALADPAKLLEVWRDEGRSGTLHQRAYYSFERSPAALMRRVASAAKAHRWSYAVTSLAGASLIAPFVRGIATVPWYLDDPAQEPLWVNALDLRPVESGPNAILLAPVDSGVFYRSRLVEGIQVVGNIQLYLDLCHEPARGKEQAEFLRRRKLKF